VDTFLAGGVETMSDVPIRFSRPLRKRMMAASKMKAPAQMLGLLAGLKGPDFAPVAPGVAEFSTGEIMGHSADRLASGHISPLALYSIHTPYAVHPLPRNSIPYTLFHTIYSIQSPPCPALQLLACESAVPCAVGALACGGLSHAKPCGDVERGVGLCSPLAVVHTWFVPPRGSAVRRERAAGQRCRYTSHAATGRRGGSATCAGRWL
jgi:hypothetical protein